MTAGRKNSILPLFCNHKRSFFQPAAVGRDDTVFPTLLVSLSKRAICQNIEYPILFYLNFLTCTVKNEGCHFAKQTIVQSMGWIRMSERDLKRIEVLSEVLAVLTFQHES